MNSEHLSSVMDPRLVEAALSRSIHPDVLLAIEQCNPEADSAASASLKRLQAGRVLTLFAGQQVMVGLGPLFLLSKVGTLLAQTKALESRLGKPVVPIFWLQTEDHDLPEITSFLPNALATLEPGEARRGLTLEYPNAMSSRVSVGALPLGANVVEFRNKLKQLLELGEGSELTRLLDSALQPELSFGASFSLLLRRVFSESGLLVFDPRHPLARKQSAPIFAKALSEHFEITKLLTEEEQRLSAAGFVSQVKVLPDSPLLFFHPNGPLGPRYRLHERKRGSAPDSASFAIAGSDSIRTLSELVLLAESSPESFSTSALLRPILQDCLFPSLGTVVGPSEEKYFKQLNPIYSVFGLSPSMVIARAPLTIVEPKTRRLLEHLNLQPSALTLGIEKLKQQLIMATVPDDSTAEALEVLIQSRFDGLTKELRARLAQVIPDSDSLLVRPTEKVNRAYRGFLARYRYTLKTRDSVLSERIAKLKILVFPNGETQERGYALLPFWCKYGAALNQEVFSAIQPLSSAPIVIGPL